MPRDDEKSLGDEATLQGGKVQPADERSLGDRSTFGGSDGSSLSDLGEFADLPDHDMEIVDLSSRYNIEKTLGKGGMGEVLLATDTRLDRKVAIKRIRGDAGSSKAAVARFLTEAKSVAALNHHNVVQIHDYGRDQDGPFLIMEYVPGGTLLDRCKQGPIELEEAIDLACQLCDGLGRAHDTGIIHRDIKPANILLTNDGVPKLTDFGLAKADSRDHTMTMAGAVLGTLDFMPPEQRQDSSLVDARSDLWSLAATLYQMVTGKSPKIIRFDSLPPSLTSVLGQALEENKEDRYQNSTEMRAALIATKTSSERAAPMIQDLGAGECPVCHTLNESSRKFCRECATPLQVPCLQCSEPMAIWDKVCGECGGKQQTLLEERNAQHAAQRREAERFRADFQFSEAIDSLKPMQVLEDQRFIEISEWARNYATEIEEEAKRRPREAQESFAESQKHRDAFDYPAAITSMQQIPAPFLTPTMALHLRDMEAADAESKDVLAQIRQAIKTDDLDDLLPVVEKGIELRGDRKDLPILRTQLLRRIAKRKQLKKTAINEAKKLLDSQQYEEVIAVLSGVPEKHVDDEVRELAALAKTKLHTLRVLGDEITSMQSDDDADFDVLTGLLHRYLELKHDSAPMRQLLDNLVAERDALIAHDERLLEEAIEKHEARDYTGALAKLNKISVSDLKSRADAHLESVNADLNRIQELDGQIENALTGRELDRLKLLLDEYLALQQEDRNREQLRAELLAVAEAEECFYSQNYSAALSRLQTIQTEILQNHCAELKGKIESAVSRVADLLIEIRKAVANQQHNELLTLVQQYLQLNPTDVEIQSLQEQLLNREKALARKQKSQEMAAKERAKITKLVIACSAVAVVSVLIFTAMYYLQPQSPAKSTEALSNNKTATKLQHPLSNGDNAAAQQLGPKNAQALSMNKKAADINQAIANGDYAAVLQLDPENAWALSMKNADIQEAISIGNYAVALQLDPNNAEALSMKKAADIQLLAEPPITNSIGMKLKSLPSGTFMMGDANGNGGETPHEVTLTKSFHMGIYEVTQSQYEQVMVVNFSEFRGAKHPVDSVSWQDAVDFCRKLSELPAEKAAGRVYRLPTEAEWEYACCGGTTTTFSFGNDGSDLGEYGWYSENSERTTHPVGGKQPNAWGLYDMHGNVAEWCQDQHGPYPSGSVTNPSGAGIGSDRVFRGGSWGNAAVNCRSAVRYWTTPSDHLNYNGFRVILIPSGQ